MIRRSLPLLVLAALVLLPASVSMGDTLILKNGAKFEGKVVDETATHVIFKIRGMGKQKFRKSDILRIEEGKSVFDELAQRRKALKADDADGHYELGMWCKEKDLRKDAEKEFQAAIAADPEHAGARKELGFVHYELEWITQERYDEIMAEIREREGAIIAALALKDEPYLDEGAAFSIGVPKGDWEIEKNEGIGVAFTGPELGKTPVTISLEYTPADATLAEDLDEFVKGWLEKLGEDFEKFEKSGDPASAKLAGADGKLLASTYTRDDVAPETVPMERRDVIAKFGEGYLRLSLECRSGYAEKLSGFFEKVRASVKKHEEATPAAGGGSGDAAALERGYTFKLPDDTYVEQTGNAINFGRVQLRFPPNTLPIACKTTPVLILFREGKVGDGGADATSLQTLRDAVPKFFPNVTGLIDLAGNEKSKKVAGNDALSGDLGIGKGRVGSGHWCVFKNGDRYYQAVFLNFGNNMGEQYSRPDFQKFLDSLEFK